MDQTAKAAASTAEIWTDLTRAISENEETEPSVMQCVLSLARTVSPPLAAPGGEVRRRRHVLVIIGFSMPGLVVLKVCSCWCAYGTLRVLGSRCRSPLSRGYGSPTAAGLPEHHPFGRNQEMACAARRGHAGQRNTGALVARTWADQVLLTVQVLRV
jgi:hypothetical protein